MVPEIVSSVLAQTRLQTLYIWPKACRANCHKYIFGQKLAEQIVTNIYLAEIICGERKLAKPVQPGVGLKWKFYWPSAGEEFKDKEIHVLVHLKTG